MVAPQDQIPRPECAVGKVLVGMGVFLAVLEKEWQLLEMGLVLVPLWVESWGRHVHLSSLGLL